MEKLQLPSSYSKSGYKYVLVKQNDKGAIYKQDKKHSHVYEVFEKRISDAGEAVIGGKNVKFEAKYKIPANEDFGKWAFSVMGYERANQILDGFPEFSVHKAVVFGNRFLVDYGHSPKTPPTASLER